MKYMVEITPSQTIGWQGVAAALASSGLACQLVDASPNLCLTLHGSVAGSPVRRIARALEGWLAERGTPLLPQVINDVLIVLRPPAA